MEEPAFLRRLRQEHSGGDQQNRYIAPRNRKTKVDDDEDAPTYVLEGGNDTITVEEFKAMNGPEAEAESERAAVEKEPSNEAHAPTGSEDTRGKGELEKDLEAAKDKILEVGVKINKRKAVKMIGTEAEEDAVRTAEVRVRKRGSGKAKGRQKVKLSFEEDE